MNKVVMGPINSTATVLIVPSFLQNAWNEKKKKKNEKKERRRQMQVSAKSKRHLYSYFISLSLSLSLSLSHDSTALYVLFWVLGSSNPRYMVLISNITCMTWTLMRLYIIANSYQILCEVIWEILTPSHILLKIIYVNWTKSSYYSNVEFKTNHTVKIWSARISIITVALIATSKRLCCSLGRFFEHWSLSWPGIERQRQYIFAEQYLYMIHVQYSLQLLD